MTVCILFQSSDISKCFYYSEVRECLKLDPDHKMCYDHYKNVKKMFKAIQAGKEKMTEKQ